MAITTVDWFESGATEEYLDVYGHRGDEEAAHLARLVDRCAAGIARGRALDVGCGSGRHLRQMRSDRWIVGLDLSVPLLRIARQMEADTPLVRADMRALPFGAASFTLVVNLFTSFGYFGDDREHQQAIGEIARVVRPGGMFVLDFLNAVDIERTLVAYDERHVGLSTIEETRQISADGRYVTKNIRFRNSELTFRERVRLFRPAELIELVTHAGFEVVNLLGDYSGALYTAESPRAIVVSRKLEEMRVN